jgi:hypothetical protein
MQQQTQTLRRAAGVTFAVLAAALLAAGCSKSGGDEAAAPPAARPAGGSTAGAGTTRQPQPRSGQLATPPQIQTQPAATGQ